MSDKIINPKYRCTQSELYAACRIGWSRFKDRLDVFSSKKGAYDVAYADAAIAEIDEAQNLPDHNVRSASCEQARERLTTAGSNCCIQWLVLKCYILDAFRNDTPESKLVSAGEANYSKAFKQNWEYVLTLMSDATLFIANNEAALTDNMNMPPAFPSEFATLRQTYLNCYNEFKTEETKSITDSQLKLAANNALYVKMMAMFREGRTYFSKDKSVRKLFTFSSVLQLVTPTGSAGLTGTLLNAQTGGGINDAGLSLFEGTNTAVPPRYQTRTTPNGGYDFGQIASGTYTLKMEHSGFTTRLEKAIIKPGVRSTKTFTLIPVS